MLLCIVPILTKAQYINDDTVITQHIDLDTLSVSASAGRIPYQPSATQYWDITHTRIALSFDFRKKSASVREWITLHPYCYTTDSLVLDAKSMQIDTVALRKGNKLCLLNYEYSGTELKIHFRDMYAMEDTIQLYLTYTATPYARASEGSAAITDDKGMYFINTDNQDPNKPAQIWTQGETQANSHWMITIDKPNSRFTSQIELTVPDTMTTLSNGKLTTTIYDPINLRRTDIWQMNQPIQAYVNMFAIGKFSIVTDHWRGKQVSYYVEPRYAPYARMMFSKTTEMLEFFSNKTGVAFPWNKYSQIVVHDYVSGAMENTAAALFGEYMNQTPREYKDKNYEDVVTHELFHMWFGDYATCESWSNITLNESFANYGEQLWHEYKYGTASADELAWNDLHKYIEAARTRDPQLVRYYYDNQEELFDAISYQKGGALLRYIHHLIGDKQFERAMKTYLTQNAFSSAEVHSWRMAIEKVTGQDWNQFFDQWYFQPGHPVLDVDYRYDDNAQMLTVTVTQTQERQRLDYDLQLKTAVIYNDQATQTDWHITKRKTTFTYPYKGTVAPTIVPDVTHILPGELIENKQTKHWLAQYRLCNDFVSRLCAVNAAGKQMSDGYAQEIIYLALLDTSASIRKTALEIIDDKSDDRNKQSWTKQVNIIAKNDRNNDVRAAALKIAGYWGHEEALPMLISAVWDSSYTVAGSALNAIAEIDRDTAYAIAKTLTINETFGTLDISVWTIIGKTGKPSDVPLLKKKSENVFGKNRLTFAASLNSFLESTNDELAFRNIVDKYAEMTIRETSKMYRERIMRMLLQTVDIQKQQAETTGDKTKREKRIKQIKSATDRIIEAESEPDLKEKFRNMAARVF